MVCVDINIAPIANYIMHEGQFEKVVFLGDQKVGKSRLLEILTTPVADAHEKETFSETCIQQSNPRSWTSIKYKNLQIKDDKQVQIWDSEEYRRPGIFRKIYLQKTKVFVIVFDLSKATSFSNCSEYLGMATEAQQQSPQVLLVGTCPGNSERQTSVSEAEEWCTQHNCFYLEATPTDSFKEVFLSKLQEMLEKVCLLE